MRFFFRQKELTSEFLYEIMTTLFLTHIGLLCTGRGMIWIGTGDEVLESATVYRIVAEHLPIQSWGLLFLISGLLIISSAFTKGKFAFSVLFLGNLIAIPCNAMMYMASTVDGINLYTPFSVGVLLITNIILFIIGGLFLWIERKKKNM